MRAKPQLSNDGKTLTIHVPMEFRKRGGRKLIIAPDGGSWAPSRPRIDNIIVKALVRAHRWKRLLESGEFGSIADPAKAEKINESYACRILRLTLLAPSLVEAILDGQQARPLQLERLLRPFPVEWPKQGDLLHT